MENKFIGLNMLDEDLTFLINAMAKSYPVDYSFVTANLNPDGYEYVKVIDDTGHKSEVYKWEVDAWVYVGEDKIIIKWDDVQNKPVVFVPSAHTHTKADITDFTHEHPEYSPINHNHDGVYPQINHNHDDRYALTDHAHDSRYSLLAHNHDGRYYTQAQINASIGNLLNLLTTDQSNLVNAINEVKNSIGSGTVTGGGGDMPLLVVEDEWEGSTNITKEFSSNCMGFSIVNQGSATLVATINGKTIQVDSGESFENIFKPFKTLSIAASGSYKALVTAPYGIVATVDTTPPANVTSLVASNITGSSLTLNWIGSVSSDTDSYEIYQGSTLLGTTTGTTFNVSGLAINTSYVFTIKAKDISGNVANGTSVNATTTATVDTTPPINVTNLTASNVSASGALLSWTNSVSNDTYSYEIYNGATLLGTVVHPNSTYNATGLTQGTSYTLTVKAKDTSGNIASGTNVTFSTIVPVDTTPPVITASPIGGSYSSANVTLTSNEAATIYYTTDGTMPTETSAVYSSPLTINSTTTLKYFGKDTAGNSSTVQTQTYTITAAGSVVASDSFTRADAASLGTAPTGQTWSNGLQVIGNQAGTASNLTAAAAWNTMETNKADNIEITLDIVVPSGSTFSSIASGIVFRFKDTSNMYAFGAKGYNSIGIYQAGATGVTIPANKTLDMIGTHTLKVKIVGQTVECYVDNILQFTFTDTAHTTGTKHGMALYSTTSPKLDNFSIKTI